MSDYSSDTHRSSGSSSASSRSSSSASSSSAASSRARTPSRGAADKQQPTAASPTSPVYSDDDLHSRVSQQRNVSNDREALIADVYKFFRITPTTSHSQEAKPRPSPSATDPSVETLAATTTSCKGAGSAVGSPTKATDATAAAAGHEEGADDTTHQVLDLLSLVACKRQGFLVTDLLPFEAARPASPNPSRTGSPHNMTTSSGAALNATTASASSIATATGSRKQQQQQQRSTVGGADEVARKRAALRSAVLERRRLVGELAEIAQSYEPRRIARMREEILRQRRETPSAAAADAMEAELIHVVEHGRTATAASPGAGGSNEGSSSVDAQRARALNAVRERGARAVEKLQRIHERQLQSDVQQQLTQQQLLASLESRERAFRALRRRRDRELRHRAEVATAAREEKLRTLRVRHEVMQAQRLAEFVEKRERADERLDGILAHREQQQKERRAAAREQFERVRDGARAARKAEEDSMWAMELERRARDGASMEARDLIHARKDLVREMRRQKRHEYHARALEYRAECQEQLEVRRLEAHLADAGPKVPLTYHRILGANASASASRAATPAAAAGAGATTASSKRGSTPASPGAADATTTTSTTPAQPSGMAAHLHTSSAVYLNPQPRRAVNVSASLSTLTNTAGTSLIVGAARKALDDKRDAERARLRERRQEEQRAADLRALEAAAKDRRDAAVMHERDLEREAARRMRQREDEERQRTHEATLHQRKRAEAYRAAIDAQLAHNAEAATEARRIAKAEADAKMQAVRNALERERELTLERLQRDRLSGKQHRALYDAATKGNNSSSNSATMPRDADAERPRSTMTQPRSLTVRDAARAASTSSSSSSSSASADSRSYSSDARSPTSDEEKKKRAVGAGTGSQATAPNADKAHSADATAPKSPQQPTTPVATKEDAAESEAAQFDKSSSSSSSDSFESDSDNDETRKQSPTSQDKKKGKLAAEAGGQSGAAAATPATAADQDLPAPSSSAAGAGDVNRAATAAPPPSSPAKKATAGGGAINAILQQLKRSRNVKRTGSPSGASPSARAGSSKHGGAVRAASRMQ